MVFDVTLDRETVQPGPTTTTIIYVDPISKLQKRRMLIYYEHTRVCSKT
jgi:hypothetical protein